MINRGLNVRTGQIYGGEVMDSEQFEKVGQAL